MLSVVAFVPAHTYGSHAYFWNLVTYSFVETNILLFAIDAAFILTFLPIFERMWGAAETACFFLACVASAALLLLISLIACFAVTLEWKVLQVRERSPCRCALHCSFQLPSLSTSGFPRPCAPCSFSSLRYTPATASLASPAKTCRGPTPVRATRSRQSQSHDLLLPACKPPRRCLLHLEDHQRRHLRGIARCLWRRGRFDFPCQKQRR